ncbi:MAG: DUF5009 domain-containing protein [Reichenbachiella sp.]
MSKKRLLSLDVFRGLTIIGMILVNNPGDWGHVYAPLLHAQWHGWTPTDLVFPFFLFMVGLSVSIGRPKAGTDRKAVMKKVWVRAAKLFLLGLFLGVYPDFDILSIRIPGVLQRIAIVFVVIAYAHQYLKFKSQLILGISLLLGYYVLMAVVPVPGVGPANFDMGTNLAAWLDFKLLPGHLWSVTETWDPEGVLSTLPSIVTGLIGIWTGRILFGEVNEIEKVRFLAIYGVAILIIGLVWNTFFPINKSLWTSTFVLATGGVGVLSFTFFYWLLDIKKVGNKAIYPLKVFGMNAITAYVFSSLLSSTMGWISVGDSSLHSLFYTGMTGLVGDEYLSSLLCAIITVMVSYIPVLVLYKKGMFLKV